MRLTFCLDIPHIAIGTGERGVRNRFVPLQFGLEYLTKVNEWHLSQRRYPLLYESGVRYHTEEPGLEEWWDIPTVLQHGWGDCEDLGCWRVAELRHNGVKAKPDFKVKRFGEVFVVHILARWPDGRIEDPSKLLGMKGEYQ